MMILMIAILAVGRRVICSRIEIRVSRERCLHHTCLSDWLGNQKALACRHKPPAAKEDDRDYCLTTDGKTNKTRSDLSPQLSRPSARLDGYDHAPSTAEH